MIDAFSPFMALMICVALLQTLVKDNVSPDLCCDSKSSAEMVLSPRGLSSSMACVKKMSCTASGSSRKGTGCCCDVATLPEESATALTNVANSSLDKPSPFLSKSPALSLSHFWDRPRCCSVGASVCS
jgi:hypothetical protein